MKAVFTSICISIVLVSIAQDEDKMVEAMMTAPGMEIKSSSVKLQKESRPALTAYVNGETSKVEKKWKKYLAEACGCALKRNKGFYEGLGVQLPTVTMETISIFTRVEDDDDGARLDVAVDFGGKFLSDKDSPTEAANLKNLMTGYLKEFYISWYESVIKDQRRSHEKLAREHDKLIKEGEKLQKSIGNENNNIKRANENTIKAEQNIVSLQAKLVEYAAEIERRTKEIESLEVKVKGNEVVAADKKEEVDDQGAKVVALKAMANSIKSK